MLGGYISDLEKGDVFKPVEYVITPFMCSEYAHGVEETSEYFHSARNPAGRQVRPPTMIHVDKMRILEENCDKEQRISGMKGPDARVHYEYHAKHHSAGLRRRDGDRHRPHRRQVRQARPAVSLVLPRGPHLRRAPGHDLQRPDAAALQDRRSDVMSAHRSYQGRRRPRGPGPRHHAAAHRVVRQRDAVGRHQRAAAGRRPTSTPTRNSPRARASPRPTPTG